MPDHKIILLVEDEPLLANLLKQRLEKEGYAILSAGDGEEALSVLKANRPDLILLDVILPKMSGFELMEQLKNNPAYGSFPIVIISNLGQDTDVQKGKMLGAVGYFVKAKLSIEDLVKRIKSFLSA